MLTRDQVTTAIREWMERVKEADGQINAIGELFGDLDYDAPRAHICTRRPAQVDQHQMDFFRGEE